MPIHRAYMCPECGHRIEVVLTAEEWDKSPPSCDECDAREMNQDFKPPAIGGIMSRAARITEDIIANDYGVSNLTLDRRGGANKVTYKDQSASAIPSEWQKATHAEMLQTAIGIGRANRGADGLDILKRSLANGSQVDLIEASKRRSIKVWSLIFLSMILMTATAQHYLPLIQLAT